MTDSHKPPDLGAAFASSGQNMRQVNDKLRDLVEILRSSKERLAGSLPSPVSDRQDRQPPVDPAPASTVGAPLDLENRRLGLELARAREQLAQAATDREELRKRLDELEADHRRVCDQFVEAEGQASELVQAYATLQQIHGAAGRDELLQRLQEVVINVIGSEELAIFEVADGALLLARAFGVDPRPLGRIPLGQGVLGGAAQSGRLYVAGRDGASEDDHLTAGVPLRAGGAVVGLIAIYRLLAHKPGLEPVDHAIFDLLSEHAGQALWLRRPGLLPA